MSVIEYRFLAIEPETGIAHIHEHPPKVARAVAATLRTGGLRIAWYPAPPPEEPTRPTRRDRKAGRRAARVQERQLAELGA